MTAPQEMTPAEIENETVALLVEATIDAANSLLAEGAARLLAEIASDPRWRAAARDALTDIASWPI
jgi:hypothetical protein